MDAISRGAKKKPAVPCGLLPAVPAVGCSKWVEFPLRLVRSIGTVGAWFQKRSTTANNKSKAASIDLIGRNDSGGILCDWFENPRLEAARRGAEFFDNLDLARRSPEP